MSDADTITWERQEDGSYVSSDERASIIKDTDWELEVSSANFRKTDFETLTAAKEWYANAPAPVGPNEIEESNMPERTRQRLGRIATALHDINSEVFTDVIRELQDLTTHDGDLTSDEVDSYRQTAAAVSVAEEEKIVRDAYKVAVRVAERLDTIVTGGDDDVPLGAEVKDRVLSRLYGDAFRLEKLLGQHGGKDTSEKAEDESEADASDEEIVEAVDSDEDEEESDDSSDLAGVFDA